MEKTYLSTTEAGQMLNFSRRKIQRFCRQGKLRTKPRNGKGQAFLIELAHVQELLQYMDVPRATSILKESGHSVRKRFVKGQLKGIKLGEKLLLEPSSVYAAANEVAIQKGWYSISHAAMYLRLSERNVWNLCQKGELEAKQIGPKNEWRIEPKHINEMAIQYFKIDEILRRDQTFTSAELHRLVREGKMPAVKLGSTVYISATTYNTYVERRINIKRTHIKAAEAAERLGYKDPISVTRLLKQGRLEGEIIDGTAWIDPASVLAEIKARKTRAVALPLPQYVTWYVQQIEADPLLKAGSKKRYRDVVKRFAWQTGADLLDVGAICKYIDKSPPSTGQQLVSILGRYQKDLYADQFLSMMDIYMKQAREAISRGESPPSTIQVSSELFLAKEGLDAVLTKARRHIKPGVPRKVRQWLDREEVVRLLESCGEDHKGRRDHALLCLLTGTGLRISEAIAARFDHLSYKEGRWWLLVPEGPTVKSDWAREIGISAELKQHLDTWAELCGGTGYICRTIGRTNEQRIADKPIKKNTASQRVNRHLEDIGRGEASPHDLRRSWATQAIASGILYNTVQREMGHKDFNTTKMSYIKPGTKVDTRLKPLPHGATTSDAIALSRETLQAQYKAENGP